MGTKDEERQKPTACALPSVQCQACVRASILDATAAISATQRTKSVLTRGNKRISLDRFGTENVIIRHIRSFTKGVGLWVRGKIGKFNKLQTLLIFNIFSMVMA